MSENGEFVDVTEQGSQIKREPKQLSLFLTIDGFEGPIDVLLSLAREQKVDLKQISILELAQQYLNFIQKIQMLNLEIAADYLVMAAWLAYLKSRLLVPEHDTEEELSAEDLASALRLQLEILEAMRKMGQRIMERPQLGIDFFSQGSPKTVTSMIQPTYDVKLFELLKAYANCNIKKGKTSLRISPTQLFAVEEAISRLRRITGNISIWSELFNFLPDGLKGQLLIRSAKASTFAASLELVKDGKIELRQEYAFGPIFLRNKADQNE